MEGRPVDIYAYQDFRLFLKDFYKERRAKDRKFSIRFFARRAGLKSQNYLKVVMDGRRSLTSRNLPKFIRGLGLAAHQAEYFEALVNLNQSRDPLEEKVYQERLQHLQKKNTTHILQGEQLELFSKWYYLVIFELASQEKFNPDPNEISRALRGRITTQEAQAGLEFLLKIGILKKTEDGTIKPVPSKIIGSEHIPVHYVAAVQKAFLELAQDALLSGPSDDKDMRSLTIGLASDQIPVFKEKLKEFQREMNTLFSSGKGTEIYQLNLQFFRLTKSK